MSVYMFNEYYKGYRRLHNPLIKEDVSWSIIVLIIKICLQHRLP